MTTILYFNIDNSYVPVGGTGTGDGTQGNPLEWAQFEAESQLVQSVTRTISAGTYEFRLSGTRVTTEYLFPFGDDNYTITITSADLTSPWKIHVQNAGSQSYFGHSSANPEQRQLIWKNGILKQSGAYPAALINFSGPSGHDAQGNITHSDGVKFYNVHFEAGDMTIHGSSTGRIKFYGCSIYVSQVCGTGDGLNPTYSDFVDCAFMKSNVNTDLGVFAYTFRASDTFNNCVFPIDIDAYGPPVGANNQSNWTPTSAPSVESSALAFYEQTIAPDGSANDILFDGSHQASGSFTGYEYGLFGGVLRTTSRGIGAFRFQSPLAFVTKPSSFIASSKKFIYQPVVTGDTVASWTITTMPSGMTLNDTTGRIEWTPLTGTSTSGSLTLTAHSTSTGDIAQTFTLAVDTAPRIVSTAPDSATNGSLFNYQPVVSDAESNLTATPYTLVNAPVGMSINATSGLVSWTPASTGVFHFTVKVVDANGLFDAQLVTLTVS